MFEEINAHRQAVQENIEKAFEVGFTGNEDLEKAHQVGDIHPNGKWVWTQLPSGKYDWRVIKNKQGDNSTKSSSSKQAVDISKIPDKEFKRITNMLEKKNPLEKDAPRYLEEEAMSDSELKNFLACAEHFKNDTKNINQLTRYRCSEWAKLAKSELDDRQQSKKAKSKDVTQSDDNSEYDAQKLEHLSEDELSESAKKFGVWARVNRHGEIFLEIPSKKEVKNLKKFLSSNGIEYDESKLSKQPGFYGTHSYGYDLYSGKQENSIGYYERKARYIQNDIDYLTNSSKNHPDVRQRAAAKKELENGSLKRELDEVKEKIASLKKMGK